MTREEFSCLATGGFPGTPTVRWQVGREQKLKRTEVTSDAYLCAAFAML